MVKTLIRAINGQFKLTEDDREQLFNLLAHGRQNAARDKIAFKLKHITQQPSWGIYNHVVCSKGVWEYHAGQSYSDEIKRVRDLFLKG